MSHVAAKRRALRAFAVVALMSMCVAAGLAQSTVAGHWTLNVDGPQGAMSVAMVLAVEGEAVKGSVSSEMGEATFKGTLHSSDVSFSFDMSGPQGPMTVKTKATVTGDDIKGEMDYGMGIASFTGKRTEP